MALMLPQGDTGKGKGTGGGDTVYGFPNVALLNARQWLYLQRRYHMSPRETEVAKLVCCGMTNRDVARHIKVKPGTVKTHLRSIFHKTRVKNKMTMLLRFMEDIKQIPGDSDSGKASPIPVVDIAKAGKKPSSYAEVPEKEE